jgi:hypothetical protein|tara:strand:- start:1466 stop:1651 length:186 start_codon:yes stop_codon:yes gene_type:complete
MQIISLGDFYFGIEEDKYCDLSIHLGNLLIEYQCPSAKSNDKLRPKQGGDGLSDGKAGSSN